MLNSASDEGNASPDDTLLKLGNAPSNNTLVQRLLREETLKKKRLARKAELARLSRKRKRERLEELEDEVARLKEQLHEAQERERVLREVMQVFDKKGKG